MNTLFWKNRLHRQITMFAFSLQSIFWIAAGISAGAFFAFTVGKYVPYVGTPLSLLAALAGLLAGLWMSQASMAVSLPLLYGGQKIECGPLSETLARLSPQFYDGEIPLYVLKDSPMGATVFVAGFFPFKPRIFVERSLIATLGAEDWEPILAHELSHIRLKHLKERSVFLFKTIFLSILFSTALLTGLSLMGISKGIEFAAILSGFLPIILCQLGNRRLVETQEFEADFLASVVIPDGKRKLNETLRKISAIQGMFPLPQATEDRIRKLVA